MVTGALTLPQVGVPQVFSAAALTVDGGAGCADARLDAINAPATTTAPTTIAMSQRESLCLRGACLLGIVMKINRVPIWARRWFFVPLD